MQIPDNLEQVTDILTQAFCEFGIGISYVKFSGTSLFAGTLLGDFVLVESENPKTQCWINFSECTAEISERESYCYMAGISTRGAWEIPGIVAYGLCKFAGYAVFNDSGQLDRQASYSIESLRGVLLQRLP
jgi:hypothetical protein